MTRPPAFGRASGERMATYASTPVRHGSVAEINVTPMIDVMLVLLIIFMISLPWIAQGFPVVLPGAAHADSDPDLGKDFVVGLDGSGNLYWNGAPIAEDGLRDQLAKTYSGQSDHVLYLKADTDLYYGRVQQVMELARAAGVRVLATVTEPANTGLFQGDTKKN